MFKEELTPNTIIDAGHYTFTFGPSELDTYLWEEGVKLYTSACANFQNTGLMLLVDDMKGIKNNEQRRTLNIQKLPPDYQKILESYSVPQDRVQIVSQDRLREKGKQLLRGQEQSRDSFRSCELVIATLTWKKQRDGYTQTIGLYDEFKTKSGNVIREGITIAQELFGTTITSHYGIFQNSSEYKLISNSRDSHDES